MRKNRILFFCIVILAGILSCDDLLEKDITGARIIINSPTDSFVTANYDVNFWWKEVPQAKIYRLQIVSPSFDNIQKFIVDTPITYNRIALQLQPGKYEWRIRAENGSSYTEYVTRSFAVDSNSNLSGQSLYVNTPEDNYYINSETISFKWSEFPFATSYEINIIDVLGSSDETVLTQTNQLTRTFGEGSYKWKVRAINEDNASSTQFSVARLLVIDFTSPFSSVPLLPADNSTDTNSVRLVWSRDEDAFIDSLVVAADSLFQDLVFTGLKEDTQHVLSPLVINETYFWKLKTRDRAGNWSNFGSVFRFQVTF